MNVNCPEKCVYTRPFQEPERHTIGAPSIASASFQPFSQRAEAALGAPIHGAGERFTNHFQFFTA
jgi:hypothetical protein